ncbi:hypothetical protein PC123_g12434 [Phytophthora cactorum]|nr:hypothetical protein PC123_g12434 [Phytophthora cactorum]
MVERYFKLKPFLDAVDDELAVYMPSPLEDKRLCGALDELKDFESSDGEGAVSWKLFGSPGPIFKFPIFERACVQVQNGETRYMTSDDIAALAPFASQGTSTFQSLTSSNSAKKLSFAEEELKKRRMQDQQQPSWSTTILRPQMWLNAFFYPGWNGVVSSQTSDGADSTGEYSFSKDESTFLEYGVGANGE